MNICQQKENECGARMCCVRGKKLDRMSECGILRWSQTDFLRLRILHWGKTDQITASNSLIDIYYWYFLNRNIFIK